MEINEKENPLTPFFRTQGEELSSSQYAAVISVMARYKLSNVPSGYKDLYIDNSPAKEEQGDIYALLESYIKSFTTEGARVKSLYLYSKATGTGKTTTAIALLHEYIRRRFMYHMKYSDRIPEVIGYYCDINKLQQEYNLATMSNDDAKLKEIADRIVFLQRVEFLVLDDIGIRSATESFRSLVHAVINERVTNELPTIYTSNVPVTDLKNIFDERLYDRINDQCAQLTFGGKSKRGMR